ncbi:MAG: hemerythrin domain-containing protein [Bacteroidota bacterium]
MTHEITEYLANDHDRLDGLLKQVITPSGEINTSVYHQFRQGLLRHIGIEEKILIPALQSKLDDTTKQTVERIRMDHSAIVALLVPPPSSGILTALKSILTQHNELEEAHGGFYERADLADTGSTQPLVERVKNFPDVKSLPNNSDPKVFEATRRALERAGYAPEKYLPV